MPAGSRPGSAASQLPPHSLLQPQARVAWPCHSGQKRKLGDGKASGSWCHGHNHSARLDFKGSSLMATSSPVRRFTPQAAGNGTMLGHPPHKPPLGQNQELRGCHRACKPSVRQAPSRVGGNRLFCDTKVAKTHGAWFYQHDFKGLQRDYQKPHETR